MSIGIYQLALLKSGEEVIADIAEIRKEEDELVSYLFKNHIVLRLKQVKF